jgi:hypothetical protein
MRSLVIVLLLGLSATATHAEAAGNSVSAYACGGRVEVDVWRQWDDTGFRFAQEQLIEKRLVRAGDTYALYDLQTMLHNLLSMSQRCKRSARQLQLISLVIVPYAQLTPAPGDQIGRAWLCRGGFVCNRTNRLINTEVVLPSVQFLAFASSLAQGLNQGSPSESTRSFIDQTARVVLEHLTRWSALAKRVALRQRIAAKPADVRDGSSSLFFTDNDLWQIALYADLAGLLATQPQGRILADDGAFAALQEHLLLLLRLFAARTTIQTVSDPLHSKSLKLADLDSGFWRLHADSRYAGYTGTDKPVVCTPRKDKPHTFEVETLIDSADIAPVANLGWDLSHARRLVHVFDAIERNRVPLVKVFGLAPEDLPSRETIQAFARQLRMRGWNQDEAKPLFANFFNGTNGWYRVAYDNGTGRCMAGYPPYGLTDAFPTGGFATWAALDPGIRRLGERLYVLTQSRDEEDQAFVNTYYANLGARAGVNTRMLAEMMFWPTLIKTN